MIGKVLGERYEILEQIGVGGMALVYKARCRLLDRIVAIKILKNEFANDDEFVGKFKRESQAAASLSHPNIVNIYDVGLDEDNGKKIHYIVMEYIRGGTLKDLIRKKGKLSISETIDYSSQIANALEEAHKNNIVHRDIKPQNIMITEGNMIKVTDFGIARATSSATATATSDVLGSVHYSSPEQARGGYTDEKSDIYSLGIVMYEMATGVLPYTGESPITVALKHIQEDIVFPSEKNKDIPKSLENIILKAVQKRQSARYKNISEILEDLKKIELNLEESIRSMSEDMDSHTRIIPAIKPEDEEIMSNNIKSNKKVKKNKKEKKKTGMKTVLLGVLLAFVVTFAMFYFVFRVQGMFGGKEIEMVNLVSMQEDEARKIVEDLGLSFEVEKRVKNPDFKDGQVVYQNVKEGTMLKKDYPIKVTISEGDELIEIPDLINKDISIVEQILKDLDLKTNIKYEFSDVYDLDSVMDQSPRKGSEAEPGDRIFLTVSKGKELNNVLMPGLIDWNLEDAKKEILKLGLSIGNVSEEESETVKKGKIIWQSYKQGAELERKTSVDLLVSSGIAEREEPEEDNKEPENNNNNQNNENNIRESTITFTVTPFQDKEETQIKIIRIQDGVSEVVHNKTYNVNEGNITLTQKGKLGSKFEIYYDDEFQTSLTND